MTQNILILDDDPRVGPVIKSILESAGYGPVDRCCSVDEAGAKLSADHYALVLADDQFSEKNGFDVIEKVRSHSSEIPVVVITNLGSVDVAVSAMRRGAFDVIEKPFHPERAALIVKRALEHGFLRTEVIRLTRRPKIEGLYRGLIGESPVMKKVFHLLDRIRESDVNVLITGPSGVGKEMVARAIHDTSLRAKEKFTAINCSAIPETLLEGELFGYKKGAFTDARTDKIGLFCEADCGTIFLDEIGDMPLALQPKILRVLQEREVRPLGATQTVKVDVRVIAATNEDLGEKIRNKTFRDDLYYRLNVINIALPSLKDRPEDIPLLVDQFLKQAVEKAGRPIKGVSQSAMKLLLEYSWPGNIRELQNVIERAALLTQGEYILPEDFPFSAPPPADADLSGKARRKVPMEAIEKEYILEVLKEAGGNRSEAAQVLGIGRKTLYNKLERYGMEVKNLSNPQS
ncbi:MAG: sigma-54-dependent Fis family transcriptional regulator [Deltaproteobacteria bacterium]|nr:sigma-54-dependent Fis family transcriptional regulator [Deltaproteobacteria bacterium]